MKMIVRGKGRSMSSVWSTEASVRGDNSVSTVSDGSLCVWLLNVKMTSRHRSHCSLTVWTDAEKIFTPDALDSLKNELINSFTMFGKLTEHKQTNDTTISTINEPGQVM